MNQVTDANEQAGPTLHQAIASLTHAIENGFSHQDDKLDMLTDQIGHLSELVTHGFTELKELVQKQSATAAKQAETVEKQAATVDKLVEIVQTLIQQSK